MLDTAATAPQIKGMYIDGQWQPSARQFDDINPSDGSVWARLPDGGISETKQAVEAAHRAFPAWSALSGVSA